MSDLMQAIRERRSIRQYQAKALPDEALSDVLDAVRWAPSWANTQCWEVIVVRDPGVKEALQQTLPEGNPSFAAIVDAPVVLALCGKLGRAGYYKGAPVSQFGDWFLFDLGIGAQNIALAAHAHGLATVVVGLLDHDKAKAVLNVPEGHELATLMPLGYPAQEAAAPERREVSAFTHYDRF